MTKSLKILTSCLFLVVFVGGCKTKLSDASTKVAVIESSLFKKEAEEEIHWYTFEEAVALNEKEPKNLLIDFYTTWCHWCKVLDQKTWSDKGIAKIVNQYYYPVKFDAEQQDSIVFQGKTYKLINTGGKPYHELAASLLQGKMTYPTVIFLDPEYRIIAPIAGFIEPQEMEPILSFLGLDLYKDPSQNWQEYQKNYKRIKP
ncbi:MAG: DUF255 domain-containing protein [Chitinophagales bacterium]|nr:DUF255 domain-containing protein [Chitinophagales bacterium]